jgi:predicted membrane-bound mannosyltransferase/DNA-binding beta-propeller fold protein YncE
MEQKQNWLQRPIHSALPGITNEIAIFAIILLVAIATRFYDLGARVMSHDESLHTYFSWLLYRGQGYQHTPMMHGPWQFHFIALSYFLFGASDFTARIPAALFSIATVLMTWHWRRYIGKAGVLIASAMVVISPFMLFYGRYVREDVYAGFAGVLMLYVVLRYLETGASKYLYLFAISLLIHFLDKETSFIYVAQLLIFLTIYLIARFTRRVWVEHESDYRAFVISLVIGAVLIISAVGLGVYTRSGETLGQTETAAPADPSMAAPLATPEAGPVSIATILAVAGALALGAAIFFLIHGFGWERIRSERSFDLAIVAGTIVLPMLTAFPLKWLEPWLHAVIPTDAASVQVMAPADIITIAIVMAVMFLISIGIGLLWDRNLWWKIALLFWAPFIVLFTTFFTNSDGFFTGVIGSLGYWLEQQGVERGSQPWYFYALVQLPIYEFLAVLGFWLALYLGLRRKPTEGPIDDSNPELSVLNANFPNMFSLLVWWSVTSLMAFSIAGEKMPWLTYHLVIPLILLTGWALGQVIETTDWVGLKQRRAWLVLALTVVFIASLSNSLFALIGATPPFQGQELSQLQATSAFLLPALVALASAVGLYVLLKDWSASQLIRVATLTFFALLAALTVRASFRAAYITYDQATEFLVYAHGATGIKDVIRQAAEISQRTTGGMTVPLAYDASAPDTGVSWPFVWYLRDFTDQRAFDQPTRALREAVVVIVDQKNFDKIDAALGPGYYRIDYIRMWWPMQDYFNLVSPRDASIPFDESYSCNGLWSIFRLINNRDFSRVCNAFTDARIRAGILNIWLNRDYTLYAEATGHTDLTVATWQPADQMRLYIRKDVASQIWNYGVGPSEVVEVADPTEGKLINLDANLVVDHNLNPALTLNTPRSIAFARNGTFYVADSLNHRILHLNTSGQILHQWGTFADGISSPAPLGAFNEPWGVAVGPNGSVYVTDTWNHRVQKFTATGSPIKTWGTYGLAETPDSFYGPRGIAVDTQGRVYVADTGNKRIVVYDADGNYITEFGSAGFDPGQFDEPVGVTVDSDGRVYVVDTWNQRIQTFIASSDGLTYFPDQSWDVYGWFGQSLDNKPFIAVNEQKHVFITDPEGYRVMEFSDQGELLRVWGDYGDGTNSFGLTAGIAIDPEGNVWVADPAFNRILRFTLP